MDTGNVEKNYKTLSNERLKENRKGVRKNIGKNRSCLNYYKNESENRF